MQTSYFFGGAALLFSLAQAAPATAQIELPRPSRPVVDEALTAPRPFRTTYLRVGLGTAYDIGSYYHCARFSAEYAPMLTRQLGLASRLVGVLGAPTDGMQRQVPNQNYRAAYLEQEAIFYPFGGDKRVRFGVGAGGFAGYYKKNSFDFFNGVDGHVTNYQLASWQGVHAGYLFSLNLDLALDADRRWLMGLKSTMQNGVNGITTTPTHSLTLARRI